MIITDDPGRLWFASSQQEVRGRYGLVYWQEEWDVTGPSGRFYGYVESAGDRLEYFDPEEIRQYEITFRAVSQIVDSGDPNTVWPMTLHSDEVAELPPGLVSKRQRNPLPPPPERPTWDVTYRGVQLTRRAWDAHLEILRRVIKQGEMSYDTSWNEDWSAAWGALVNAGVLGTFPHTGPDFRWFTYHLTPYGKVYARQRLEK